MAEPKVYIFWDNSNIFISAKNVAQKKERTYTVQDVRVAFDNMFHLAHADRSVGKALAVGTIPPEQSAMWERFRESGVDVELYERGARSGTEQSVDSRIQVEMLRQLADNKVPQIAVLLTGDGAGYDDGVGFHADLERMQKSGWGIEVIAWDISCKRKLKEWAESVGIFIPLERYYESVTFMEEGRRQTPLNLTHRLRVLPAAYDPAGERKREKARLRSQRATQTRLKKKKSKKRRK